MSLPRLRAPKRTKWDKADRILEMIQKDFGSLGDFLVHLFHNSLRGNDPRSARHVSMVSAFLQGSSHAHMGEIIELLYHHRQSNPRKGSSELSHAYSPTIPLDEIRHARPCLSAWAAHLVGEKVHNEVGLGSNAATSTRSSRSQATVPQVTWEDLGKFSIPTLAKKYKKRAPLTSYLTESMAAPRKNGMVIVRQRRPHTAVMVGAISAFVLARNRFANYLALNIGVWQFAILSRFGFTVHDSTVRDLEALRRSVAEGIANGEMTWKFVLDNVQQYEVHRESRIGRQPNLKVGTAATAIKLDDCAPGAFNLADHLERVMKMERKHMTTHSLYEIQALHWVPLEAYRKPVSALFRSDSIAKHCMRKGRKTVIQPLGTNGEKEVETQGMKNAILDFEKQMGLDEKALEGKIVMPGGDGASYAAILRIKKYMAAHQSDYKSFRGRVSVPELWHTRATNLNAMAENHYGPIASPDPSSLSKSAAAVNVKRPSNLKKCDFYPTAPRVLDCWRVYFDVEDLTKHFENLQAEDKLPTLEKLRNIGRILVRRYTSQEAYEQALSSKEWDMATDDMKVPKGTPWTAPVQSKKKARNGDPTQDVGQELNETEVGDQDLGMSESNLTDNQNTTSAEANKPPDDGKTTVHVEAKGFDGDRVLANAILFLQDAGWWVEAAYAVPEGDIGRVYQIIKIWIFSFTGTANRNYSSWLLELYCLFRYESSKDLSDAILNNWLVNITGELGKWIEADLLQEHYNRWLEDMAGKMGGEFDDKFYRHTLSPNVQHFLRLKEEIESAFDIRPRTKAHGSAHLRDEFQSLLRMHKEDELHRFRPGRSMGHAAANTFNLGYARLDEGRMESFIENSLPYARIVADMKSTTRTANTSGNVQREELEPGPREDISDGEEDDAVDQHRPMPGQQIFVDQDSGSMVINEGPGSETDSSEEEEEGEEGNMGHASSGRSSDSE
ncbi:hypothetical protein FPV67DRAFT_1566211 [Lyophyllum atratum]|nr:hypothetical protein FPV67DRAFT_1566211 [Lyophyllum atratum]